MNKFWIVVFHTYKKHLKSKAFIVSTMITMLLISALANVGKMYSEEKEKEVKKIGIVTEKKIEESFKDTLQEEKLNIKILSYKNEEEAKEEIEKKKISAYLLIENDTKETIKGTYKAKEIVDQTLIFDMENILNKTRKKMVISSLGLDERDVDEVNKKIILQKEPLNKSAKGENEIKQSLVIVFISLFLIYATVVFYGNVIATEVASEKSSRVMEVLVSSAPAAQQMFGKIIGLALLGMTQYFTFFFSGYFSFQRSNMKLDEIPHETYYFAVLFFILGYFLYATLLAMMGSLVNRIEDVHQLISPINVLIIVGFVLSMIGFIDPKADVVTIGSFIPFFAPMLMFLRVAILDVPVWQLSLSVGILVLTIVLFSYLGSKVYKGGVLIYGKTTYKNIAKALILTKENKR